MAAEAAPATLRMKAPPPHSAAIITGTLRSGGLPSLRSSMLRCSIAMNVVTLLSRLACFFFQAEDGIRGVAVTGVQTCALPIFRLAAMPLRRLGEERHRAAGDLERRVVVAEDRGLDGELRRRQAAHPGRRDEGDGGAAARAGDGEAGVVARQEVGEVARQAQAQLPAAAQPQRAVHELVPLDRALLDRAVAPEVARAEEGLHALHAPAGRAVPGE